MTTASIIVKRGVVLRLSRVLVAVLVMTVLPRRCQAKTCLTSADCWTGSYCQNSGYCSNPYERGCFYETIPEWNRLRVCNSDDPKDAVEKGLCRQSDFDYMELRVFADNWDSATYAAWIMQVVLSELLDVPCTLETGIDTAEVSFYQKDSRFDYGISNDPEALVGGNDFGDCRLANRDALAYEPCANAVLESWVTQGYWDQIDSDHSTIEPAQTNGMLGQEAWFVTKFTAAEDPSIVSYLGLVDQREKLARMFLRPTTWGDYCAQESPDHCATPNDTAQRAPQRSDEAGRYYLEGLYNGYFRATEENDCETWPDNCTGHIADYPCGWSSTLEAQTHHLDIPLRSSGTYNEYVRGYSYSELNQLWHAANATKSNLIMYYWNPEPLYHQFEGTDAAFTRINLPPPTQECYDHQVSPEDRCSPDQAVRVGEPEGACDEIPDLLDKVIAASLYDLTFDGTETSNAAQSPGYDALRLYHMDNLQLGNLLNRVFDYEHPRAAVCEWMVENMDYMKSMVPPTYPRVLERQERFAPFVLICMVLGGLTLLLVAGTMLAVYVKRHKRPAQAEFLFMVLGGSLLLSVGAIFKGAPPKNAGCTAQIWLVTIGYTLQLVPLIVKMAAIHRMVAAARRMRRVTLQRRDLYTAVVGVVVLVVLFLIVWSASDAPSVRDEFILTGDQNADGATIVELSEYCASNQTFWEYVSVGWTAVLLLCSSVIAFQTRNLDPAFNESRTLAFKIYSHFVFVLLRLVVLGLKGTLQESSLSKMESIVLSLDTIAGIFIYFYPLLTTVEPNRRESMQSTVLSTIENRFMNASMVHSSHNRHHGRGGGSVSLASKRRTSAASFHDENSCGSSSSSTDGANPQKHLDPFRQIASVDKNENSKNHKKCPCCGGPVLDSKTPLLSSNLMDEMALSEIEDDSSTEGSVFGGAGGDGHGPLETVQEDDNPVAMMEHHPDSGKPMHPGDPERG